MRRRLALAALLAFACAGEPPEPPPFDGECWVLYGVGPICKLPEGYRCLRPRPDEGEPCWQCLSLPPPP